MRSTPNVAILVLLGLTPLLGACGKKGPPLPPQRAEPASIEDLVAVQRGQSLVLSWQPPADFDPGDPEAPALLELFVREQQEGTAGDERLAFFEAAKRQARTPVDRLPAAGGLTWLEVELPDDGQARGYAVRYVSRSKGKGALSRVIEVAPGLPPDAPPAPVLELAGAAVVIRVGETPASVYRRAEGTANFPPRPLESAVTDSYHDTEVRRGDSWCYALAARPESVESALGPPTCMTVQDLVAPGPPGELLAAVMGGRVVLLLWDPPPAETDVAGYHVYRTEDGSGSPPQRLTQTPVETPRYRDDTAEANKTYTYAVTALDTATPPNEGPPSPPTTLTVHYPKDLD